jgi:hypothetical protein
VSPTSDGAPTGRMRRCLVGADSFPLVAGEPRTAAWALRPSRDLEDLDDSWQGSALAEISGRRRAVFPLLAKRALGVDFAGGGLRVEPLSAVALPAWDLLMASGGLGATAPEDAMILLTAKKTDALLGLAAAYVVHAAHVDYSSSFLDRVLRELERPAAWAPVPDLDLLSIALTARKRHRQTGNFLDGVDAGWFEQVAAERLKPWAERGSVPVLRWGVPLAVQILGLQTSDEVFARWRESLVGVERGLSPTSVWTAWVED